MEEFACFQISKGADRFELHVQGSEAWIDEREEASRAELEGSTNGCMFVLATGVIWLDIAAGDYGVRRPA
jgi:hypothetical protein